MRPRWRKVISDLLDNKARTILVVLSIAVGVFAIGVLAGTYIIISEDIGVTYAANNGNVNALIKAATAGKNDPKLAPFLDHLRAALNPNAK